MHWSKELCVCCIKRIHKLQAIFFKISYYLNLINIGKQFRRGKEQLRIIVEDFLKSRGISHGLTEEFF